VTEVAADRKGDISDAYPLGRGTGDEREARDTAPTPNRNGSWKDLVGIPIALHDDATLVSGYFERWKGPSRRKGRPVSDQCLSVRLSPRSVAYGMSGVATSLVLIHIGMQSLKYLGGHDVQLGLLPYFNLDEEGNLPAWYASSTLLLCAGLLGIIAQGKYRQRDRYAWHWLSLSLLFVFLSLDEATTLHERLVVPMREAFPEYTTGYFYYAWVIPVGAVLPMLGLIYGRFLLALPRRTAFQFLLAGGLYIGGALGVELFGAKSAALHGVETIHYALLVALEEGLEMSGIVVFATALVSYGIRSFSQMQ